MATKELSDLYFEAHVTISPEFDERLEDLTQLVGEYGFKVADLLFQKRSEDTPIRSKMDTFCTSRSRFYTDIETRTRKCVKTLQDNGYKVWRYKIEDTLLDVRLKTNGCQFGDECDD